MSMDRCQSTSTRLTSTIKADAWSVWYLDLAYDLSERALGGTPLGGIWIVLLNFFISMSQDVHYWD